MAKKKRKNAKKKTSRVDIQVTLLIIASVVLAILIYTQSGYLGKVLTEVLGGLMGWIKYLIPIGTFSIAIYIVYDDKEYLFGKLVKYALFLLSISILLAIVGQANRTLEF